MVLFGRKLPGGPLLGLEQQWPNGPDLGEVFYPSQEAGRLGANGFVGPPLVVIGKNVVGGGPVGNLAGRYNVACPGRDG